MSKARKEKLAKLRADAIKLDGELKPMIKDPPPPGVSQKIARRLQASLGLFVELTDLVETMLTDSERNG